MSMLNMDLLFRDKPLLPGEIAANYTGLDVISHGFHIYGQLMWPDSSFKNRPVVILFHGFPGCARNDDLAHALCRIGCVVLTPHFRGAWGSEGKYLVSNGIEDAISLFDYVRSNDFCRKYDIDKSKVFFAGHSMGGNISLNAARRVNGLCGLILITPFDASLRLNTDPQWLRTLLEEGLIMTSDGLDAMFADIAGHPEYGFMHSPELLDDVHVYICGASLDTAAPAHEMAVPLYELLCQRNVNKLRQYNEYCAEHGLIGSRIDLIRSIAEFVAFAAE